MYKSRCIFNFHAFYTHVNKNQLLTAVRSLLWCDVHKFCGLCLITSATVDKASGRVVAGHPVQSVPDSVLGVPGSRSSARVSVPRRRVSLALELVPPQVNCENSLLLQKQNVRNTLNKSELSKFRPISDDFKWS